MMRASTKRVRIGLLACAIVAAGLSLASSPAKDIFGGPNSGPTNFVTVRDGTQIAVNVRMPKPYIKGHRYPAIIDMSGYVGGSSTGPTLPGELGGPSAPLAEDTTSPFTCRCEGQAARKASSTSSVMRARSTGTT